MLTGYAEPFAQNATPSVACHLETVPEAIQHTSTLSPCTVEEAEQYLQAWNKNAAE
jgi:hypothetical protein